MFLRNDASKFRARRSPSGAVQRLNAASRRRRWVDAVAVATFAASFVCARVDDSNVYAQLFQSKSSNAQSYQAAQSAQTPPQRGSSTAKNSLFAGKFTRGGAEKASRAASQQTASRRYAPTPDRGAPNGRPSYSTAPGSAARNPSTPSPFGAPNRAPAAGYAASRSYVSNAAPSAEALAQASTGRESAQEALAKIPWKALSPSAREKLVALSKNPTIYRRLPMGGGYCNPELFDFFLTHPHAVVGLWRQMGYDDVAMAQIGPNLYSVREKTGTVGRAQILYQDNELTLVYCNGKYQGPIVPRSLDGEMFLVLQTRYTEDPTGRPIVVCRLDAFVDLKNPGADVLARAFSGALGKLADSNFEQTLAFIDNVSQTAEAEPGVLSGSIAGLSELSPEEKRLFAAKTSEIARQAQLRARGVYVDYRLLPKLNSPTPTVARVLARERAGASNAVLAARSPSATSAPIPGFETAATPSRSGSAVTNSPLSRSPSTVSDFETPSLAQNSFALADDAETDYDFEAELDWNEEESIKVGGARVARQPLSAPSLVPETSVAKAAPRPTTRFADALDLVDSTATVDNASNYAAPILTDDVAILATDVPESTTDGEAPLLLDFENELLEEAEKTDANDVQSAAPTLGKPAPLVALPTPDAADAIALPSLPAASNNETDAAESALPVLVFDAETNSASPTAPSVSTPNETTQIDDVPLLLLPDFETSNAVPQSESPKKTASQPSAKVALKNDLPPSKTRGRAVPVAPVAPVVPVVPNAKKPSSPQPAQPTSAPASAPVWRAVEPKPAQAQVAPPIAETARVAPEKGATFRKPEIH